MLRSLSTRLEKRQQGKLYAQGRREASSMPGTYTVNNVGAPPSRGGLALPLPPTQGPIVLQQGRAGLLYRFMGVREVGDARTFLHPGIWTDGISDCVVLTAVEWDPLQRCWTNFCWRHLKGGYYKPWRDDFRANITQPANCCGLIASRDWIGTSTLRNKMVKWGIPDAQITTYIAGRDFKFGLRFFGGAFGEV